MSNRSLFFTLLCAGLFIVAMAPARASDKSFMGVRVEAPRVRIAIGTDSNGVIQFRPATPAEISVEVAAGLPAPSCSAAAAPSCAAASAPSCAAASAPTYSGSLFGFWFGAGDDVDADEDADDDD
jgi:hypothetical protein